MDYTPSDVVHLFSFETKVSIELPTGWELTEEGDRTAIFVDELVGDGSGFSPKLIVKVIPMPARPGAYKELALHTLELPRSGLRVLAHSTPEVDGFPAMTDVFRYFEEQIEDGVVQYQVFVQADQVLFSLTGIAMEGVEDTYLPVFEAAVRSVRFIPLAE